MSSLNDAKKEVENDLGQAVDEWLESMDDLSLTISIGSYAMLILGLSILLLGAIFNFKFKHYILGSFNSVAFLTMIFIFGKMKYKEYKEKQLEDAEKLMKKLVEANNGR